MGRMKNYQSGEIEGEVLNTQNSRAKGQDIDWGKYGLSEKSHYEPKRNGVKTGETSHAQVERGEVKELFEEEGEVKIKIFCNLCKNLVFSHIYNKRVNLARENLFYFYFSTFTVNKIAKGHRSVLSVHENFQHEISSIFYKLSK